MSGNCGETIFEYENRRLQLSNGSLSTNFRDNYYFAIKGDDLKKVNFNFSSAQTIKDSPNEIRVRGTIYWEPTHIPFDVIFVDPKARTKEWLVYRNF